MKKGEFGTDFKAWCDKFQREGPSDEIVTALNNDREVGSQLMRQDVEHPRVYRNWITYISGKGRR